jgi:acetolactate synthase-1/2/3 large subunit
MNNADLIVRILKSAGIRHGFGVPSGNVLPLMESMRTGGIDFVLTAHEGSAAFAADVSGRQTGVPGLCIATLGPGATNLTTGVGSAYLDRSPLIAITCTLNRAQLGRRLQMWIDHHTLFKPITKATLQLRAGEIAATLSEALRISMTEPQGPVHLDLPEDVALAKVSEAVPAGAPAEFKGIAAPLAADLERAGQLLRQARRPVAVIGTSAMRMRRPELLAGFLERHPMPFSTTTMAKGMVDEDHPWSIGCIERSKRKMQRAFLAGADLIVALGYDTIEVEYEAWVGKVPVLHVGIEEADTDGSVTLAHQVVGDVDASLEGLISQQPGGTDWTLAQVAAHRTSFQAALRPQTRNFGPHQAIDAVRRVLPREGVLAFDVGAHTHQVASQWTAHAPRQFLITNGWSSMGFAIPAALAAKFADPARPVVCILGDGCFQMTCGEVAVAQRHRLPIPFVVLDDRWLSLIRVKQERRALPYYGTETTLSDYRLPPEHYFGVRAVGVDSIEALERELRKAFSADGPTIIEAVVDPEHYSETVFD